MARKVWQVPVAARVKVETKRAIAEIAEREQRTIGAVTRMLLEQALATRKAAQGTEASNGRS